MVATTPSALSLPQNLRLAIGYNDPQQPGFILPTAQFTKILQQINKAATNSPPITVAQLPPPQACLRAFISDATTTNFYDVVVGGGANFVPVFSDGTDWRIG